MTGVFCPQVLFGYWLTSSIFSLSQLLILRIPGLKASLGIPDLRILPKSSAPKQGAPAFRIVRMRPRLLTGSEWAERGGAGRAGPVVGRAGFVETFKSTLQAAKKNAEEEAARRAEVERSAKALQAGPPQTLANKPPKKA